MSDVEMAWGPMETWLYASTPENRLLGEGITPQELREAAREIDAALARAEQRAGALAAALRAIETLAWAIRCDSGDTRQVVELHDLARAALANDGEGAA